RTSVSASSVSLPDSMTGITSTAGSASSLAMRIAGPYPYGTFRHDGPVAVKRLTITPTLMGPVLATPSVPAATALIPMTSAHRKMSSATNANDAVDFRRIENEPFSANARPHPQSKALPAAHFAGHPPSAPSAADAPRPP